MSGMQFSCAICHVSTFGVDLSSRGVPLGRLHVCPLCMLRQIPHLPSQAPARLPEVLRDVTRAYTSEAPIGRMEDLPVGPARPTHPWGGSVSDLETTMQAEAPLQNQGHLVPEAVLQQYLIDFPHLIHPHHELRVLGDVMVRPPVGRSRAWWETPEGQVTLGCTLNSVPAQQARDAVGLLGVLGYLQPQESDAWLALLNGNEPAPAPTPTPTSGTDTGRS